MVTAHQMLATIVLVLLGALALSKIESFFLSSCIKYFCLDFVSIKSLPTKQTSPKTKIEVNSERKQAASHLFNTTVEEGKILDQQTSWRKITHRNITLHINEFSPFLPSFFLSFFLFEINFLYIWFAALKEGQTLRTGILIKTFMGFPWLKLILLEETVRTTISTIILTLSLKMISKFSEVSIFLMWATRVKINILNWLPNF